MPEEHRRSQTQMTEYTPNSRMLYGNRDSSLSKHNSSMLFDKDIRTAAFAVKQLEPTSS